MCPQRFVRAAFGVWPAVVASACALLACPPGVARAAQHEAEVAAAGWLERLAAPTFVEREEAMRQLIELGPLAIPPVEAALRSADAEVRYRSRRVLAIIRQRDFEQRLALFEADVDGTADIDLPGWTEFRQRAGQSAEARSLFVDISRAEPALVRAVSEQPQELGDMLAGRCQEIQFAMRNPNQGHRQSPSRATVAALVFAGSMNEAVLNEHTATTISNLSPHLVSNRKRSKSEDQPEFNLLAAWVQRDWSNLPLGSYQALMLAMRHDLEQGLELALAVVNKAGVQPHLLQHAVLAVAKFGALEHAERLLPLLTDESVCWNRQGNEQPTQIRDVALAALLQLTEQELTDYGFVGSRGNQWTVFNSSTLRFRTTDDRNAALKKWNDWWAKNRPANKAAS